MKLGYRKGDNASMVIMELCTDPVAKKEEKAAPAKKAAPKKVVEEAPAEEENVAEVAAEPVEEVVEEVAKEVVEEEKAEAAIGYQKQWHILLEQVKQNHYQMLILDELLSCISTGFLPLEMVLNGIQQLPKELEMVITGRNPDEKLIELADYVSEIKAVKHPYEKGIHARVGIEK